MKIRRVRVTQEIVTAMTIADLRQAYSTPMRVSTQEGEYTRVRVSIELMRLERKPAHRRRNRGAPAS